MNTLRPSSWLYDFLKSYEKFRPTAYKPTPKDKWTCGYGHTTGVTQYTTCTMPQAIMWLEQDVASAAIAVNTHVTVPLTQEQFDALVSFVFNVGVEAFVDSTLLRLLSAGNYSGAAGEFPKWDKQAGEELEGLEKRRLAEQRRFLMPVEPALVA